METISFEKWIWIQFIFLLKKTTAIYIQRTDVFDDLHSAAKLHAVELNYIFGLSLYFVHCIALSIFWLYMNNICVSYVYLCEFQMFTALHDAFHMWDSFFEGLP